MFSFYNCFRERPTSIRSGFMPNICDSTRQARGDECEAKTPVKAEAKSHRDKLFLQIKRFILMMLSWIKSSRKKNWKNSKIQGKRCRNFFSGFPKLKFLAWRISRMFKVQALEKNANSQELATKNENICRVRIISYITLCQKSYFCPKIEFWRNIRTFRPKNRDFDQKTWFQKVWEFGKLG